MVIVVLYTYALLLGLPVAIIVAAYVYYEYRKRKGRRVSLPKKLLFNVPLSLISSTWITFLIENCRPLNIPETDCETLQLIKSVIESILRWIPNEVKAFIPPEIMLIVVLGIVIYIILIPSP